MSEWESDAVEWAEETSLDDETDYRVLQAQRFDRLVARLQALRVLLMARVTEQHSAGLLHDLLSPSAQGSGLSGEPSDESKADGGNCSNEPSACGVIVQRLHGQQQTLEEETAALLQRGPSHALRHFPAHVDHLRTLVPLLEQLEEAPYRRRSWQARCVLLLWLSLTALTPFDLARAFPHPPGRPSLLQRLSSAAASSLFDSGPVSRAAARLSARLHTRPDCPVQQRIVLFNLLAFPSPSVPSSSSSSSPTCSVSSESNSTSLGLLSTVAQTLKLCPREELLPLLKPSLCSALLSNPSPEGPEALKLHLKVLHRVAIACLPLRVASWKYQRAHRLLLGIDLQQTDQPQQPLHEEELSEQAYDVLEPTIGRLLAGVTCGHSSVRYTSAKCLAELAARLPLALAEELVQAVVSGLCDAASAAASVWHGTLLALAELTRRGLLLPCFLETVHPLLVQGLVFEHSSGLKRSGPNVRDAACYLTWCFARIYAPELMGPYLGATEAALLLTALFDRELNCRRAAAAAFQEVVGRLIDHSHPDKHSCIDAVQRVNFYTVGNRRHTFCDTAPSLCSSYPRYYRPFLGHLLSRQSGHWDPLIRALSAESLAELFRLLLSSAPGGCSHDTYSAIPLIPLVHDTLATLIRNCASSDFNHLHGSVLALARVLATVARCFPDAPVHSDIKLADSPLFPEDLATQITSIVCTVEKDRLWVGSKGKIVRYATCELIGSISALRLPLRARSTAAPPAGKRACPPPKPWTRIYLDFIQDSLKHPDEQVELSAALAMRLFSKAYMRVKMRTADAINLVRQYHQLITTTQNVAAKRGYVLGLGSLDLDVLTRRMDDLESTYQLLQILSSRRSRPSESFPSLDGSTTDPDTRKNAIVSLHHLSVELVASPVPAFPLPERLAQTVDVFLDQLDDFTVDNRGDVGSWSRSASIEGLLSLKSFLTDSQAESFVQCLFVLLAERLQKIREQAAAALGSLLAFLASHRPGPAPSPWLPDELLAIWQRADWTDNSQVFSLLSADVWKLGRFSGSILRGLVITARGSSKSLAQQAQRALGHIVASLSGDDAQVGVFVGHLIAAVEHVVVNHQASKLLPLLKTLDFFFVQHAQFFESLCRERPDLSGALFRNLERVLAESRDVRIMCVCIELMCRLIRSCLPPVQSAALNLVSRQLLHSYPRIRKHSAEMIYTTLLTCQSLNPPDRILSLLLETPWLSENVSILRNSSIEISEWGRRL